MDYCSTKLTDLMRELDTSEEGLNENKARARLEKYGRNALEDRKAFKWYDHLFSQFKDPLVLILIVAGIISATLGILENSTEELYDALVIAFIVILNALIGFFQEFRAEKSLEALKRMITPTAKVLRRGHPVEIDAKDLVPGDLVLLEEGEKIPADIRLLESIELHVDEAALTGESIPTSKDAHFLGSQCMAVADRKNIIHMGTVITRGRGKGFVIGTGMKTEFGKIANLTQETRKDKSPLQKELVHVGNFVVKTTLAICALIFIIGLFQGKEILHMFLFAVSVAVAAVPEGLPVTLTTALALAVRKLVKKKAVMRQLNSVETLGSTTVICSDKTGTLTKNEMTVQKLYVNDKSIDVTGIGYKPKGKFLLNKKETKNKEIEFLLKTGFLCNNTTITPGKLIGDPTEEALIVSAQKYGLDEKLKTKYRRVYEYPFDSKRKLMSTINVSKKNYVFTKGAPEELLERCTHILIKGKKKKLDKKTRDKILKVNHEYANNALRVLAFGYKEIDKQSVTKIRTHKIKQHEVESKLIFVGLQGMIDPPRPEVKSAVEQCHKAGIKIYIITGDHGITAKAIASNLGIANKHTQVIRGQELDKLSDKKLDSILQEETIFARVSPEHKMRIVSRLKELGEIVAVTGDGVNDAPALKRADIGVAMGITGTDVSKEASSMVLMDDSFATIVTAIEEGRNVYRDIKKFLRYIFSSNLGELWAVFLGMMILPLVGAPKEALILSAVQILWVNLGTDILPALSLGVDPPEYDLMTKKPRDPRARIITKKPFFRWLVSGLVIGVGTVGVYLYFMDDVVLAGTMAFTTLVMFQMVNVFNCRSDSKSLFKIGFFTNKWLIGAVLISICLQLLVIYVPFLQTLFKTTTLGLYHWIVILLVSLSVLVVDELYKFKIKKKHAA